MSESERTGVQPYIWETKCTKSETKQRESLRHADLSSARLNGPSHANALPRGQRGADQLKYYNNVRTQIWLKC